MSSKIKFLLEKFKKGAIKFKDYASIKSGHDRYSKMDIDELLDVLNLFEVPKEIDNRPNEYKKQVLRWMCRGMPVALSIKKVEADRISRVRYEYKNGTNRPH